jgi:hypothetical protein
MSSHDDVIKDNKRGLIFFLPNSTFSDTGGMLVDRAVSQEHRVSENVLFDKKKSAPCCVLR